MLKFLITYLISLLILTILISILLDCVVGEVHKHICPFFQRKLRRRGSYITLGVPISLKDPIKRGKEKIVSNVKFSAFIKKRIFDIFLYDESSQRPVIIFFSRLDSILNFFQAIAHSDSNTSIAIFSWFHNPDIFHIFPFFPF